MNNVNTGYWRIVCNERISSENIVSSAGILLFVIGIWSQVTSNASINIGGVWSITPLVRLEKSGSSKRSNLESAGSNFVAVQFSDQVNQPRNEGQRAKITPMKETDSL